MLHVVNPDREREIVVRALEAWLSTLHPTSWCNACLPASLLHLPLLSLSAQISTQRKKMSHKEIQARTRLGFDLERPDSDIGIHFLSAAVNQPELYTLLCCYVPTVQVSTSSDHASSYSTGCVDSLVSVGS